MPSLDLFTLSCVTIVNLLLSSAALYFVARLNRQARGVTDIAAGGFLFALAFILSDVRAIVPSRELNIISNALLIGGGIVVLEGVRSFRQMKPINKWLTWGGFALFGALYAVLLYVFDSLEARTILASMASAVAMFGCAWSMGKGVGKCDRPVYWTTAGVYAIQATALVIRSIHALALIPESTIFSQSFVDLLIVFTTNLTAPASAFGISLATNLVLTRESALLARYDVLTNLPNRRFFEEQLEEAEARTGDGSGALALIYCDLDDFKSVNDTHGHDTGDRVLRIVADRLRATVPSEACLARVGGDEFLVLLEHQMRDPVSGLVRAIREAVEKPIQMGSQILQPRISCGTATYPGDVNSPWDLTRMADSAMYAVKQRGRARFDAQAVGWRTAGAE